MSATKTTIYEVHVRRGEVWKFDAGMADQDDAIAEAQRLAAKGQRTKVTREVFCEEDGTFRSETIYKSDGPKPIQARSERAKLLAQGGGPARRPRPRPAPKKKSFLERLFS